MGRLIARRTKHAEGRFLSVGVKLAGATVALVAAVASCIYFALSHLERENMFAAKEAAAVMVVRLYGAAAAAPLTFGDDAGVQDAVALLASNREVVYASAWSVSDDGRTPGRRLGELRRGAPLPPPAVSPGAPRAWRTGDRIIVEAPATDPTGKTVGVVQAAFSLAHEREGVAAMERRVLGASAALSVLLTATLLWMVRRVIVVPLGRLVAAANTVGRGEAATVVISDNDEVGSLADALVTMSLAIADREQSLAARNTDMRRVLDNIEEGIVAVRPDGVLSEERSRAVDAWFGAPPAGATLVDYFELMGGEALASWARLAWHMVGENIMPLDVIFGQLPRQFEREARSYSLTYRPVERGETLEAVLIVVRDVTERVALERAGAAQREMMVIFRHILADAIGFDTFFKDASRLVGIIQGGACADPVTLARHIHTLKGNTSLFGLDEVARRCHELESRMLDESGLPSAAELSTLSASWASVTATYGDLRDDARAADIVIHEHEREELVLAVRRGDDPRRIGAMVTAWGYERANARMATLASQAKHLARRLGKGELSVVAAPSRLRLPTRRWGAFWSVFGHVVRNAVDHGIALPDEREATGKPRNGTIRMAFEEDGETVVFRFGDDGGGIAWDRIAEKASARGLPVATRTDLERALFTDAISTRDEATTTSGRGVGMGAVLACVEALGGTVRVESERGQGTTWAFAFPRSMLHDDEPVSDRAAVPRQTSTSPRAASGRPSERVASLPG